ncbi:hypothetical protein pfor_22c2460 [Rhodobacteraceae bacterium SB2]|nr:hypothetical protein pfor_22c2460 [Rhodobacteraceae bacterium SB2]
MTQNSHLLPSDFGLNSFQELIYQPTHRAGDHIDDLDAFRDALLTDLAPIRPHEAVMAENIIMIEWDIAQILIQKRHIARSAIFDEITNQYVKLAKQEFYEEGRRQRLEEKEQNDDFFASITSFGDYDVFDPHDAKIAASKVIAQLKSGKVDQIEKAQVRIKVDLPSPETILAVVYETGSKYRELDDVLTELEKRRRRILEDYKNLQSARAIEVKAAE